MDAEITVIGAGVVGLAVSRALSVHHKGIFVVEKHVRFGQETSSRNSEVVHSGIYYPPGSLKATLCVSGKKLLYDFCRKYGVAHRICGKIVVATNPEEEAQLENIRMISIQNGVHDVKKLKRKDIFALEPHVRASAALYYPTTGIIDTHGLMKMLETLARQNGTDFVYGAEVTAIEKAGGGYRIVIRDSDGSDYSFTSRKVVNSAGLGSDLVAAMIGISDPSYRIYFWKGEYFRVSGGKNKMISGLVYPVPQPANLSLGIHATPDLGGQIKLGPNALFMEGRTCDYSVNPAHAHSFCEYSSIFLPFLEESDLIPDQAGIRPKLQKPGDPVRDFIIREESPRGLPGFVNLVGIESPGLTSCLAIGDYVSRLISDRDP